MKIFGIRLGSRLGKQKTMPAIIVGSPTEIQTGYLYNTTKIQPKMDRKEETNKFVSFF
jgi:hypothetical protein